MTEEHASATFLGGTRGEGKTQSLCWEPDNREIYRGAGRHKQGRAQQDLGHPAASLKGSRREAGPLTLVAVKTMMCWTSRQVRHGRTCSISAIIPAARGAAADVPVWPSVQPVPFCKSQSVVTFRERGEMPPVRPLFAMLGRLGQPPSMRSQPQAVPSPHQLHRQPTFSL